MIQNSILLWVFIFSIISDVGLCQRSKKGKTFGNVGQYNLIEFSRAYSKDSVLVTAFVDIPFQSLQFIKKEKLFFASYDVSISLVNNKDKRILRKMWSDSITTDDYIQTQSRLRSKKHFTNFKVAKDKYIIESELYDKDTRKKGSKKVKIDFSKQKKIPSLLEPVIVTDLGGNWGFDDGEFPITGKRITNIDDGLTLILSGFVDDNPYLLELLIEGINEENKVLVFEGVDSKGFFFHKYPLDIELLSNIGIDFGVRLTQSKKKKEVQKKITIYKPGLSGFVENVESSFQQMKYILTNDERKNARGKKGKELEQLFLSYWQQRDPTPNTSINELMEEYYIRVNYVNEYFNMSWKEGWETDFGMIYVLFGPPDEIQRSTVNSGNTSLYQVWYYNRLNKQFVFKDQNGFGDFKLDRPFIGPDF